MKKFLAAAAVVAALTGIASVTPASAAPPTATVSPGYDAALVASRPTDVSSRRYYRRYRGYYGPRYYRPAYGYGNPYYGGGGYYGRPYYGGGYGPGIGFRFGF